MTKTIHNKPARALLTALVLLCLGWGAGALQAREDPFALQLPEKPVIDRVTLVQNIKPNSKVVVAHLNGPGCIQHILLSLRRPGRPPEMMNRRMIIRIYFDGSDTPNVEGPVGDFFGLMHGIDLYDINTDFLSAKQFNAYSSYFKMPFAKDARIEFECGPEGSVIYMQVSWNRYPGQEMKEQRRFCAQWRREMPTERYGRDYLMLDADGPGNLVGFFYGVRLIDNVDRWSHGGAENIYIDGHGNHPSYIRGIGGEDTFGTSYGGVLHSPETHLFAGMPYYTADDVGQARSAQRLVGYRFFATDTIEFRESIHMRFGSMENDICSMVYWYQPGVPRRFVKMPDWEQMLPGKKLKHGSVDLPLPDAGSWLVSPPLENKKNEAILRALGKGGNAITVPPKSKWKLAPANHGFVDINHLYRPSKKGVGVHYNDKAVEAVTTIEAPSGMKARLRLAWDDHLVLRINGNVIDMGSQDSFRAREIEVQLKKGKNNISATLSNTTGSNHGGWTFNFMATTPDGARLLPRAGAAAD